MTDPSSVAAGAGMSAVQLLVEQYLDSAQGRADLKQLLRTLPRELRGATDSWYRSALTDHLLISEDPAAERWAALSLKDAIEDAGKRPPTDLGAIVTRARELAQQRIPVVPELRRRFRETDELIASTGDRVVAELREDLAGLRSGPEVTDSLPPRIGALLQAAEDNAAASAVAATLGAVPTRSGFDQLCERLTPETRDPDVLEALGRYAHARHWDQMARQMFEAAAACSARPERLWIRAAWCAKRAEDAQGALALLDKVAPEDHADLHQAVSAAVRDQAFTAPLGGVDFADSDEELLTLITAEGLLRAGQINDALELVGRWREATDSYASKGAEAELRRVMGHSGPASTRTSSLQEALRLGLEARRTAHDLGLPSPGPTSTAVMAAAELHRFDVIVEMANTAPVHRTVEFADPEVAAAVMFAHDALGSESFLGEQAPPFYRRLFDLSRLGAPDAAPAALSESRELLDLAETKTQHVRALIVLGRAGHQMHDAVDALRQDDPCAAAIVESAYLSATGHHDLAAAKLRPFARDEPSAAVQLVHVQQAAGDRSNEAAAALEVWQRHGDAVFLGLAAEIVAAMADADDSLVERLRNGLTEAQATVDDDQRIAQLLDALIVIHFNRAEFDRAVTYARALLNTKPDEHSRWRIATSEFMVGNYAEAWRTLTDGGDRLPRPRNDVELRLLAVLLDSQAQDTVWVSDLLTYSAQAIDSDVEAMALLACQRAVGRTRTPDGRLARQVWEAVARFADANPDSAVIRCVRIDENDPLAALSADLPRVTDAHREIDRFMLTGAMPYTMAAAVTGKFPARLLTSRGSRPLHAASNSLHARQRERRVARQAVQGPVVVDVTGLHVLAELVRVGAPDLLAFVDAVLPTPVAQDVATVANEEVGVGVLAPTGDPGIPAQLVEFTPEQVALQEGRQRSMGEVAARLDKQVVPAPLTVTDEREELSDAEYVAWAGGELGLRTGLPVWVDDGALREWLRPSGVETFGTHALIDVLHEQELITMQDHAAVRRVLRQAFITDLPTVVELTDSLRVEGPQPWGPLPLRLRGWWNARFNRSADHLERLFTVLTETHANAVAEWFANACVGIALSAQPSSYGPPLLLLFLLARVPDLRPMTDALVKVANEYLWCVPTTLSPQHVAEEAERLSNRVGGSSGVEGLLAAILGDTDFGVAVREAL